MPPKQTEIGNRLRTARQKLNLSQSQAAKKWKISVRTLQQWEQGQSEPQGLARQALEAILKDAGV